MTTFPRNYAATNGGERKYMTNFLPLTTLLLALALPAQAIAIMQPAPVVGELASTLEQSVKGIMESRLQGGISIGRRGAAGRGVNPLEGTHYTAKVRQQIHNTNPRTGLPDNHGFPLEVDNLYPFTWVFAENTSQ